MQSGMRLIILTADELIALDTESWAHFRRAARETPTATRILRAFLDHSGPLPIEEIADAQALKRLHDDDLIRIREGRIDIAYPFSALPTPFMVRLSDGRERYACCATDALGFAPMIGEPIEIRSRCHHSDAPLRFSVSPEGPALDAAGVMLWSGKRVGERCRSIDGL
jgi:alkylmercury lyase-like protein